MALLGELFHALKQKPAQSAWDPSLYNLWQTISVFFEVQWRDLGQQFPDDALVHYNAGLWMVNVHNYQDAIVHLRAATGSQRLPESLRGAAFQNLGLALLGTGQFAEAESSLLAALKQPQPDVRIQCLFAMLYKQTGRLEEAARAGTLCLDAPDKEKVQ
jgi:Tfp pilus assembly protein PilF